MPLLQGGGVRRKEVLNGAACLLSPSLPIRSEACTYPSVEFPDVPMIPLPARSYPGINGRPSLVINPIPPHLLKEGGLGDLGLDL